MARPFLPLDDRKNENRATIKESNNGLRELGLTNSRELAALCRELLNERKAKLHVERTNELTVQKG